MVPSMTPCILWTGAIHSKGYGRVGKSGYAHRKCWEDKNGPIPEGYDLHHRCHVKLCINLEHLELLSHAAHRSHHGGNGVRVRYVNTHCKHGHEYTSENSYFFPNGWRKCRTCARAWQVAHRKDKLDSSGHE